MYIVDIKRFVATLNLKFQPCNAGQCGCDGIATSDHRSSGLRLQATEGPSLGL